jgi:hypothetical protein
MNSTDNEILRHMKLLKECISHQALRQGTLWIMMHNSYYYIPLDGINQDRIDHKHMQNQI